MSSRHSQKRSPLSVFRHGISKTPERAKYLRRLGIETLESRTLLSIGSSLDFPGVAETVVRLSDSSAAAGPAYLLAAANSQMAIYSKSGQLLDSANLDTPSGPKAGFFEEVDHGFGALHPSVLYDRYAGRFVVVANEVQIGTLNSDGSGGPLRGGYNATQAYTLIAVSTSANPNDLDTAPGDSDNDWYVYCIPTTHDFGGGQAWLDTPKVAVDDDSLYITGNYYKFGTLDPAGTLITRLNKNPLLCGSLGWRWDVETPSGVFDLQPAQSMDKPAPSRNYSLAPMARRGLRSGNSTTAMFSRRQRRWPPLSPNLSAASLNKALRTLCKPSARD